MTTVFVGITMAQRLYDALPDSIRERYSFEQWLWLPNEDKASLEQQATDPDWVE